VRAEAVEKVAVKEVVKEVVALDIQNCTHSTSSG